LSLLWESLSRPPEERQQRIPTVAETHVPCSPSIGLPTSGDAHRKSTEPRWHGEPALRDLLADPVMRALMSRDRVDASDLLGLAGRLRRQFETTDAPAQALPAAMPA